MANTAVSQVTVGAAAVQIDPAQVSDRKTVLIKAAAANTVPVYIGIDGTVTAAGATGGVELGAKEQISLTLDDTSQVWAISTAPGQIVSVFQSSTALG